MKKIFHLSTCDTCKRIIKETGISESEFDFQDIKKTHIDSETLEFLRTKVSSYEELFNKRARKYKEMGLKDQKLSEDQWKELILGEYTFLKRPVVLVDDEAFVGNAKKTIEALKAAL